MLLGFPSTTDIVDNNYIHSFEFATCEPLHIPQIHCKRQSINAKVFRVERILTYFSSYSSKFEWRWKQWQSGAVLFSCKLDTIWDLIDFIYILVDSIGFSALSIRAGNVRCIKMVRFLFVIKGWKGIVNSEQWTLISELYSHQDTVLFSATNS